MKYELPKQMKLTKKQSKQINKLLKKAKDWLLLGLLHGAIIIGALLLYHLLT